MLQDPVTKSKNPLAMSMANIKHLTQELDARMRYLGTLTPSASVLMASKLNYAKEKSSGIVEPEVEPGVVSVMRRSSEDLLSKDLVGMVGQQASQIRDNDGASSGLKVSD